MLMAVGSLGWMMVALPLTAMSIMSLSPGSPTGSIALRFPKMAQEVLVSHAQPPASPA